MKITNKKGIQINQAFGAVLALVLIATLVIIGILLLVSLGSTFTNLSSISVLNETVTSVTEVPQFLGQTPTSNTTLDCNYESLSVTEALNGSGLVINSGNYTVTTTGSIAFTGANTTYNNTDYFVTYTASWGGESCTASNDMVDQFATYPALVGLVGTIIFLGLVIGVLVAAFVFGRKEGF